MRMKAGWNEDTLPFAVEHWTKGESASVIAAKLRQLTGGGRWPTRNAVIAKLHRSGKLGHGSNPERPQLHPNGRRAHNQSQAQRREQRRKAVRPAGEARPHAALPPPSSKPFVEPIPGYLPPEAQRVTFDDLEAQHCKWPLGVPGAPDFRFCGGARIIGRPYCVHHEAIAISRPVVVRRPRPPSGGYRIVHDATSAQVAPTQRPAARSNAETEDA
jgi:GcrA cell cycle regulator